MSGGHFEYKQYHIDEIANKIKEELKKSEIFIGTYSYEVEEKMKEAMKQLRIAYVYAQRIDWFLSGDDDEKNFIKRLDEDLKDIMK